VILSLGTFEKVKLYEARDFFEMTVARHPDLLEGCFRPFGTRKRFIAINIMISYSRWLLCPTVATAMSVH
jgi:hypothetical protein